MSAFIPPDWRDASAYPAKASDWQLDQWIWAFLRRNPEYQKDYECFSEFPDFVKQSGRHRLANPSDATKFRYCKIPILTDETIGEYFVRTHDETPYFYSLEDYLIDEKWEILHLADPANDEGYNCIPHLIELPREINEVSECPSGKGIKPTETGWEMVDVEATLIKPEPESWYEMTLRFDLRYSIDKQLENAKILMQEKISISDYIQPDYPDQDWIRIRGSTGIKLKNLPMYLRAYDAKQTGATFLEIGKTLQPHLDEDNAKQQAYNAFLKAKDLVYGGYRELMKHT
ncbi:MAG: DUF2285 domain-containing protein [Nitrosomonas sp. PRO4]|nr:DUF2285 domain-containing protein [Nitrosomonas sp. PRO4]